MFVLKSVSTIILILLFNTLLYAQLTVDESKNVNYLLNSFLSNNKDINIDNIKFIGNKNSLGFFINYCLFFQLHKGIVISTGDVIDVVGPNNKSNSGSYHYFDGNLELEKLANGKTFDAVTIEFDFTANTDSVSFNYIFASEEYPEYVNKGLNDVFAFFISDSAHQNKYNIAKCNNIPITVNNLNSSVNSNFFISNETKSNCLSYSVQFDGLSVKLSTGLKIIPYQKYHFKICIADVGDGYYDSAIFLEANSFASSGTTNIPQISERIKSILDKETLCFSLDSANIIFIPNITFDFNSYIVPDTSFSILSNITKVLRCFYDFKIDILGYSDSIGNDNYNINLSLKRAESISNFLKKHNIEEDRIKTFGFGDLNPISNNNQIKGRAKNRRVAIKIYK